MPSRLDQRYWDSDPCLAYLQQEPGKVEDCETVIEVAEAGTLEIVVSALTLVEVLMLRGRAPIPPDAAETVRQFFRRSYFLVVDVDRFIAEHSRELVWRYGIKPKDAVHVASALSLGVPYLDTFDHDLIARSGTVGGDPPLLICRPGVGMQGSLFGPAKEPLDRDRVTPQD